MNFEEKCFNIGGIVGVFRGKKYCYIPNESIEKYFHKGGCKSAYNGYLVPVDDKDVLKKYGFNTKMVCAIQKHVLEDIDIESDERYRLLKDHFIINHALDKYSFIEGNKPEVDHKHPRDFTKKGINFDPDKTFLYEEYTYDRKRQKIEKHYHINFEGDQGIFLNRLKHVELKSKNTIVDLRENKNSILFEIIDDKENYVLINFYKTVGDVYRIKIINIGESDELLDEIAITFKIYAEDVQKFQKENGLKVSRMTNW